MSGQHEKQVLTAIESILSFDITVFGDIKFKTLDIDTSSMRSMTETLQDYLGDLKTLINGGQLRIIDGKSEHHEIHKNISDFSNSLKALRSLDLKTHNNRNQNPTQYVTGIETDVWFNGQEIIRKTAPWIEFYSNKQDQLSQYEKESKHVLAEIKGMRDGARDNLSELGVSVHAINYGESAKEWKGASRIWLIANIVLQVVAVIFVVGLLAWLINNPNNTIKPIDRVPYVAILALLYSAAFWCSKNYRASMHQYSVCKTKEVMLSTFKTFVDASGGDAELKNAVLLEATKSIFSHIDSGFNSSKETNVDLSSKILETTKKT